MWDIATGKQIGSSFPHTAALVHASISLDGERRADGEPRWHGARVEGEDGRAGDAFAQAWSRNARGASLSPDGGFVLTFGDDRGVVRCAGHEHRRDGRSSVAAWRCGERRRLQSRWPLRVDDERRRYGARLWDIGKRRKSCLRCGRVSQSRYAAFTPAGDSLLTLAGQVVRLWDLTRAETAMPPVQSRETGLQVFSPDGKLVLRATDTAVRVYETQTNHPVGGTLPHKNKAVPPRRSAPTASAC